LGVAAMLADLVQQFFGCRCIDGNKSLKIKQWRIWWMVVRKSVAHQMIG